MARFRDHDTWLGDMQSIVNMYNEDARNLGGDLAATRFANEGFGNVNIWNNAINDWNSALQSGLANDNDFLNYTNSRGSQVKRSDGLNGHVSQVYLTDMYNYLTERQNERYKQQQAQLEAERKRKEEEARKKLEALQKQQEETTQRNKLSSNQIKAVSSIAAPRQERKNSTPILGGSGFNFGGMELGFNDLLGQDEGF